MLPYKNLRIALKFAEPEIKQSDLAKHLGASLAHVNHLMNGHRPWRLDEAYATLDLIGADQSEFTKYFPKGEGR